MALGAGTQAIYSNKLRGMAAFNTEAYVECGVSDCKIEVDVTLPAVGNITGIIFRVQDVLNYWVFGLNQTSGWWEFGDVVAGVYTQRGSTAYSLTAGQTYHLQVTLSGTSMTFFIAGVQVGSHTSATFQTETEHGVTGPISTSIFFDVFEVYTGSKVDPWTVVTPASSVPYSCPPSRNVRRFSGLIG